jgi:hypothetical protein
VGILGCLAGKFKKCLLTIPFLIFSFVMFVLLIVAGALLVGDKATLTKAVAKGCN